MYEPFLPLEAYQDGFKLLLCAVKHMILRENMQFLQLLYLKNEDVNLFILF